MTTKNLTKILTYKEISKGIEKESSEMILSINHLPGKLRYSFLMNYDSYTKEEQRKLMDKFHINDKLFIDYLNSKY
jgi:hypothetical protein